MCCDVEGNVVTAHGLWSLDVSLEGAVTPERSLKQRQWPVCTIVAAVCTIPLGVPRGRQPALVHLYSHCLVRVDRVLKGALIADPQEVLSREKALACVGDGATGNVGRRQRRVNRPPQDWRLTQPLSDTKARVLCGSSHAPAGNDDDGDLAAGCGGATTWERRVRVAEAEEDVGQASYSGEPQGKTRQPL